MIDEVILEINRFAKQNLVSINISFEWFHIRIEMIRDNYKKSIIIENYELEDEIVDIVVRLKLSEMLREINKNYTKG